MAGPNSFVAASASLPKRQTRPNVDENSLRKRKSLAPPTTPIPTQHTDDVPLISPSPRRYLGCTFARFDSLPVTHLTAPNDADEIADLDAWLKEVFQNGEYLTYVSSPILVSSPVHCVTVVPVTQPALQSLTASTFVPGLNDCLPGRGKFISSHSGNKSFRELVRSYKDLYSKSTDKSSVVTKFISEWGGLSPRGRFLKRDAKTKKWVEMGDKKAREKISQALRDFGKGVRKREASVSPEIENGKKCRGDDRTAAFINPCESRDSNSDTGVGALYEMNPDTSGSDDSEEGVV